MESIILFSLLIFLALFIVAVVFLFYRSRSLGSVKIILEKAGAYSIGEVVRGKIVLDLKKSIKAKKLNLRLFATTVPGHSQIMSPKKIVENYIAPVEASYENKIIVSGESSYFKGEYPFEIKIPTEIDYIEDREIISWTLEASLTIVGIPDFGDAINIEVK